MALNPSRLSAEPLMEAADKFAAHMPALNMISTVQERSPARPFGLRFAVSPIQAGEHSKTYYTVTEAEATEVSRDGVVETITDYNVKEKED